MISQQRIAHGRNNTLPPVVLALRRGCVTRDEAADLQLMTGKHGKGVVDADSNKQ
jgi:hypothetical protein